MNLTKVPVLSPKRGMTLQHPAEEEERIEFSLSLSFCLYGRGGSGGLLRDLENKEPNWQQPTADEEQLGAIELFCAALLLQR
jgi:hypothetical protein